MRHRARCAIVRRRRLEVRRLRDASRATVRNWRPRPSSAFASGGGGGRSGDSGRRRKAVPKERSGSLSFSAPQEIIQCRSRREALPCRFPRRDRRPLSPEPEPGQCRWPGFAYPPSNQSEGSESRRSPADPLGAPLPIRDGGLPGSQPADTDRPCSGCPEILRAARGGTTFTDSNRHRAAAGSWPSRSGE